MEIVALNSVSKKYGKKVILENASISIKEGTCVAIVGANGCGKSTLLKIMSGVIEKYDGEVLIKNKPIDKNNRQIIGYVSQDNPLMEDLSVMDNLRLWYGKSKKEINEMLCEDRFSSFGLDEYINEKVMNLSGGMKKRLSIAIALNNDPKVLILDEPTAALDIVFKEEIKAYLKTYVKKGGTVIITSHEDGELSICDEMYLIRQGKIEKLDKLLFGKELLERIK